MKDANHPNLGKILLSPDEIYHIVQALGHRISVDHPDGVHLVGILQASKKFVSDLARHITAPCTVEFIDSTCIEDIEQVVFSNPVVLCDTIRDSGATLLKIRKWFVQPTQICALIDKEPTEKKPILDYIGFTCAEQHYPVGYGLDHDQAFRNLSYIVNYDNPTKLRSRKE